MYTNIYIAEICHLNAKNLIDTTEIQNLFLQLNPSLVIEIEKEIFSYHLKGTFETTNLRENNKFFNKTQLIFSIY